MTVCIISANEYRSSTIVLFLFLSPILSPRVTIKYTYCAIKNIHARVLCIVSKISADSFRLARVRYMNVARLYFSISKNSFEKDVDDEELTSKTNEEC